MSIASRITSIEGHISDIYDSVELTGVDTTDIDKNLVNVPNTLKEGYIDIINNGTDTLYNNFPKVSGEGTSLTLNNTYQAPMRNLLKGNTSQTGTPTPTSPIPVNVVSGDNSVNIYNKNLFDGEIELGTINPANGSLSSNSGRTRSKNFIKVQPNTTYTLTRQVGENRWVIGYTKNKIGITDGNWNNYASAIMSIGSSVQSMIFTTTATTEYIKWYDTYSTNLQEKVMIEKGATANPFEPFSDTYPINLPSGMELCKIGNYQDYFYKDSDKWYLHKEIGKIASYNGETISTNYISTTGQLTTGATIYYGLSTPTNTEITYQPLIDQLNLLEKAQSKENQTNISQINNDLPFIVSASALKKG